jgi:Ca-activated chloride channel homolog
MLARRPIFENPLFSVPAIALGLCLAIALLSALLGLGKPKVAVAIVLDLSSSTGNLMTYAEPGTLMSQELEAVRGYLNQSSSTLKQPNEVKVFGFGGQTVPLTSGFLTDPKVAEAELIAKLDDPNLASVLQPDSTNLNLAIAEASNALLQVQDRCRELLVVTDGNPTNPLEPQTLAQVVAQGIKINSIFVGVPDADLLKLGQMSTSTGGLLLASEASQLASSMKEKLFGNINSNIKWIIFWLGMAWISLMWMLTLPIDRWMLQGMFGLKIDLAGSIALSHALFWTAATLSIVWKVAGIPLINAC